MDALSQLNLSDIERIRLILNGDSVVDWSRLHCHTLDEVDALLLRVGLDVKTELNVVRLRRLHLQAVEYLDAHQFDLTAERIRSISDPRNLLLWASDDTDIDQLEACAVLKVMHIIHHASGRDLLHRLEVPTAELFFRIERDIYQAIDGMKRSGIQIVEWASSRKTDHSIITKLLCRRDSQAAQIHDRLRFRIVTQSVEDVLAGLSYLCRYTIPFNYVVPGESRNSLIDFDSTLQQDYRLRNLWRSLQRRPDEREESIRDNLFSASQYRDINFVVDMAIPVDDIIAEVEELDGEQLGQVVFLLTEFQIVDEEQHRRNQQGDSAHGLYKARQVERAKRRLLCDRETDES